MGFIAISNYPLLVELIHDDTVDHQYTDEWGTVDVYKIRSIHYLNRTSLSWRVIVTDENGKSWTGVVNPLQDGTLNLPTPQRFDSYPLTFSLTYTQV